MRSGECTKYDDLMDRVLEEAMQDVVASRARANAASNGASKSGVDSIRLPESAIREGIKVVKKELEKVCDVQDK